jgi:molybdopterin converting factor small subunit
MKLNIKLFAAARDLVKSESIAIELGSGATVADLRHALVELAPQLRDLVARSMFAIDCEYATNDRVVPPNAQLALIPPVSGG